MDSSRGRGERERQKRFKTWEEEEIFSEKEDLIFCLGKGKKNQRKLVNSNSQFISLHSIT